MHIMEGMLPNPWWEVWTVLTLIILIAGIVQLNKLVKENRDYLPLLAVAGAFIFVLSSLKIPSVTGSCSHPTGTGMAAILFGPLIATVLGFIVLVFQAFLLAHGGITTLGANTFSMGFFGPLIAWALFVVLKKTKINVYINVFLAAFVADFATYVLTAIQLASAQAYSMAGGFSGVFMETFINYSQAFLTIFAVTQLPLAIIEGLIIVVAFKYIAKARGDLLLKLGVVTQEQLDKINA